MSEKVGHDEEEGSTSKKVDHILFVSRLPPALSLMGNTVSTPDSYDLAMRLGGGPAFSGSIVGTAATGFFVGTTCIWLVGRRWPYYWRDVPRLVQLVGAIIGLLSSIVYSLVSFAAGHAAGADVLLVSDAFGSDRASDLGQGASVNVLDPPQLLGLSTGALQVLILAGQLLQGMSVACFIAISGQLTANIAEPDKRPHYSGLMTEYNLLGLGLGPVAAGGAHALCRTVWGTKTRLFLTVGVVKILSNLAICLLLTTQALPDLTAFQPNQGKSEAKAAAKGDEEGKPLKNNLPQELAEQTQAAQLGSKLRLPPWPAQRRICGVLLVVCLLHFGASGLEVASVMVLEVEFGWNAARAGLVVGITFLFGLPLRRLLIKAKGEGASDAKTIGMIRWLLVINAGSCVLLFRQLCLLFAPGALGTLACVTLLLTADLLFYSSIMFAQSILRGMAMQCVQAPGEGPFDFTNFSMAWALVVDLIARTTGAPLARARLSSDAGRDGYALQQLVVLGIAWAIAEASVLRRMEDSSTSKSVAGGKTYNSAAFDRSPSHMSENADHCDQESLEMIQVCEELSEPELSAKHRDPGNRQGGDMTPESMVVGKVFSSNQSADQ